MTGSKRLALALIGWTLFVWVGRIRNVLADDELAGWSQAWRFGLATSFVALAVVSLALIIARRDGLARLVVATLAIFGIVVWAIRGADIALGDHSAGFIAVHTVLAVVTIGLGAVVGRGVIGRGVIGRLWRASDTGVSPSASPQVSSVGDG